MRRAELHGDQLIAARDLDVEPALVWEAFTTPEHLAAFWGGDHATVPAGSVAVDLRPGGGFALDVEGPDGSRTRLRFRYDSVEPPTRLVFTEPRTTITTEVEIRAIPKGARLTIHQRRLPVDLRTEQARRGLEAVLDQLDAHVRRPTTDHGSDQQ